MKHLDSNMLLGTDAGIRLGAINTGLYHAKLTLPQLSVADADSLKRQNGRLAPDSGQACDAKKIWRRRVKEPTLTLAEGIALQQHEEMLFSQLGWMRPHLPCV